ncbi:MAG: PspC domain-containing protein [Flavobacteriales bacterium]|nr:PspC domain-containing protein [Flavobacteriales bacterium]
MYDRFILPLKYFLEKRGFEVSSRFGDRLGMSPSSIRLFFIYLSFVTLGLSTGLYLILAFLLKLKDMVITKRTSVFDL